MLNKRIIGYVGITTAVLLCLGIQELVVTQERERPVGTVEEIKVKFSTLAEGRSVETELRGITGVSPILAAPPSDVEFTVNPEGVFNAAANPGSQILCPPPAEFKTANNSVASVCLEIVEVGDIRRGGMAFSETFPGGLPWNFCLVDQVSETREFGTTILMLRTAGRRYSSEAGLEQYAICPRKTNILVTDLGTGEKTGLQIYGKVSAGFYGAYQFMVRPALKVSAVRAGQPC